MAKPRVFISSTFYDLKHIRSSLEGFILSLGYDPVLSEKGAIAYSPNAPLDESCYRDAVRSDIFVLIVGGRYGSEVSATRSTGDAKKKFFDRYISVTKKEFESAIQSNTPVYVLVDKYVYGEYETFKGNRDNKEINYVHVDSVNVFNLLDDILSLTRNNPVFQFEKHAEIEAWLRDQWTGLFKELLSNISEQESLSSLNEQVSDLRNVNTSLQRYLETIVKAVIPENNKGQVIVEEEQVRLETLNQLNGLHKFAIIATLVDNGVDLELARNYFKNSVSIDELLVWIEVETAGKYTAKELAEIWKANPKYIEKVNEIRRFLEVEPISFVDDDEEQKD